VGVTTEPARVKGPAPEPDPPLPCLWLDVGAADSGLLIALWAGRDLYFGNARLMIVVSASVSNATSLPSAL
jgi:hypothetical protein